MMQMHSRWSGEVLDEEQLWRPNGAFTGSLSGRIFGAGALTTVAGWSFNRLWTSIWPLVEPHAHAVITTTVGVHSVCCYARSFRGPWSEGSLSNPVYYPGIHHCQCRCRGFLSNALSLDTQTPLFFCFQTAFLWETVWNIFEAINGVCFASRFSHAARPSPEVALTLRQHHCYETN